MVRKSRTFNLRTTVLARWFGLNVGCRGSTLRPSRTRGESGWLLRATGGWLGLPEAVSLHRDAGWWCAAQSALHSAAYLAFYPLSGRLRTPQRIG